MFSIFKEREHPKGLEYLRIRGMPKEISGAMVDFLAKSNTLRLTWLSFDNNASWWEDSTAFSAMLSLLSRQTQLISFNF